MTKNVSLLFLFFFTISSFSLCKGQSRFDAIYLQGGLNTKFVTPYELEGIRIKNEDLQLSYFNLGYRKYWKKSSRSHWGQLFDVELSLANPISNLGGSFNGGDSLWYYYGFETIDGVESGHILRNLELLYLNPNYGITLSENFRNGNILLGSIKFGLGIPVIHNINFDHIEYGKVDKRINSHRFMDLMTLRLTSSLEYQFRINRKGLWGLKLDFGRYWDISRFNRGGYLVTLGCIYAFH